MLYLQHLSLQNFKNYELLQAEFSPQINCFTGPNGSGKTSVLDAIYYLSFTKSYFSLFDYQMVKQDRDWLRVEGKYERNGHVEAVAMFWQQGKKNLKVNNNDVNKLSEHIGTYPLVMIAPGDINLIHEGSEDRRKFMDGIISQTDKMYLRSLLDYNRILEQRNRMFRNYADGGVLDPVQLESYNAMLVKLGGELYTRRKAFLHEFIPIFQGHYQKLSAGNENVHIAYVSDYHEHSPEACIELSKHADIAASRTTKGIHKDELEFMIQEFPLKKFASQGQQKSFIIALKLAQFDYLKKTTQTIPLLLLDDIFEKLDGQRLNVLMTLIAQENFGQIFITDTHSERLIPAVSAVSNQVKHFSVNYGTIHEI
jgi:DNA replication and repair protein RecF